MFIKYLLRQDDSDTAKLFADILLDIPGVVDQACRSLGYRPSQMDFDDIVQEVILLLIKDDYYYLRSFKHLSSPQTWLFTIVRRHLCRQLRRHGRETLLSDLQADSLSFQPEQESKLIDEARTKQLSVALSRLTVREQRLFHLLCRDELSASDVAREIGIKTESVYRERIVIIAKIRKMIHSENRK